MAIMIRWWRSLDFTLRAVLWCLFVVACLCGACVAMPAKAQEHGCWADGVCTPRTDAEIRASGCVYCTVYVPPPGIVIRGAERAVALAALPTAPPFVCPWPPTIAKCCPGYGTQRFPRTGVCPPPPGPTVPPPTPTAIPPTPVPTVAPTATPSASGPFPVALRDGTWTIDVPAGAVSRLIDPVTGEPVTTCERACALLHLQPCAPALAPAALFIASHRRGR